MSLPNNTFANQQNSFYALASESARNWYTFPSQNGEVLLVDASGTQVLQAIGGDLFFNQELLAKANDLQNIADWSLYPALASVNMDGFSITDISDVVVNNTITTNVLDATSITNQSNIVTATLQMAGEPVPSLGQITAKSVATSGLVSAGSISTTGSVGAGSISTTGGLDMSNTAITRASTVNISNSGFAPYGALTSPDGSLLTWNGQTITTGAGGNVSQWANYPAVATINANSNNITNAGTVNASNVLIGSGSSGNLLTNRITSLAGLSDPGLQITAYNGLTTTADAGNIITTAGAFSGTGNISTTAKGNITDTAYGEVHAITNNFEVTCDGGLNPITTPNINLVAKNGNGGQINITADPGSIAALGGAINITANGGTVVLPTDPPTSVTVGGEVNIFANTGSGGLYTLTSAVNIAAAGVNSYAGAIPPVGSLAGYNFIYGNAGVSICAGLPSSGFQLPLTTYLYGVGSLGFTGVRLQSPNGIGLLSDTYATNLYPLDGTNLTIQGRSAPDANVTILDCDSLVMTGTGTGIETDKLNSASGNSIIVQDTLRASGTGQGIVTNFIKPPDATAPGVPNLTISGNAFGGNNNYVNLANVNTLSFDAAATGAITNLQSINGAAWPPATGDASLWSQYPATSTIDASGHGIINLTTINGQPYVAGDQWSTFPAIQNVDISGYNLNQVASINVLDNATIVSAGSLGIFADTSGGNLTLATNGGGNVNIGTGNAGDINITTSGTGNNVTLGADKVTLTATIAIEANGTLDMMTNNIENATSVATGIVQSATALTVRADDGDVNVAAAAGAINVTSSGFGVIINSGATGNTTVDANNIILTPANEIQMLGPVAVGAAGAPQTVTVTGSVTATGDVTSSFGTATPYSLNTIGALVSGNQQYNYWVAVNGSDVTGTGSVVRPFASITAALAATLSISDAIPININIAPGTYTENPTMTRNNTFLSGSQGINDSVIVGTVTFNSTSTSVVSQGITGMSVVGNVICSENTSVDVSWYIINCNVTSFGAVAINCSSTGAGNNNLTLANTVVTQNLTANSAINMASSRLNVVQSQINNTTTGSAITVNGNGSLSLFGATLTCAGGATASAIISYVTTIAAGAANSFNVCSFTYTAGTAGVGKTAVFFNNSNAMSGSTTFNNNVFNIPGSSSLFLKPGTGAVAVAFGSNTTNVTTVPAASGTLSYAYTPSTPLRANALFDSTNAAGTSGQVLTAGTGGSLVWAAPSAGVNNLGVSGNLITISGGGTSADVSTTTAVAASTQKLTGISYAPTTTTVTGALTATGTVTGATVASTGAITAATNITATGYLKSASFNDVSGTLGTANQVLTAGTAGGVVKWASLTNSSLGVLPAEPAATSYQNQLVFYNTATQSLAYGAADYQIQLITAPNAFAPFANQRGLTLIVTSAAAANLTLANTGLLTANDAGFFFTIKNGNGTLGGDITITGGITTGNTVIHNQTAVMNGGSVIVRWTGTAFVAY